MVMFPVHQVWPKPSARHSERGKKTRQTEEEVGRQHQGMDRPGVRQVPEGSGEQGKMEKTGCKIICDAQTTLAVKGLKMIMIMMMMTANTKLTFQALDIDGDVLRNNFTATVTSHVRHALVVDFHQLK